jgi:hypothetical protein
MIMTLSSRRAGAPSACRDENVMIIARGLPTGLPAGAELLPRRPFGQDVEA